jgi:hypothetical protein
MFNILLNEIDDFVTNKKIDEIYNNYVKKFKEFIPRKYTKKELLKYIFGNDEFMSEYNSQY